jgi:hypothetical protein
MRIDLAHAKVGAGFASYKRNDHRNFLPTAGGCVSQVHYNGTFYFAATGPFPLPQRVLSLRRK